MSSRESTSGTSCPWGGVPDASKAAMCWACDSTGGQSREPLRTSSMRLHSAGQSFWAVEVPARYVGLCRRRVGAYEAVGEIVVRVWVQGSGRRGVAQYLRRIDLPRQRINKLYEKHSVNHALPCMGSSETAGATHASALLGSSEEPMSQSSRSEIVAQASALRRAPLRPHRSRGAGPPTGGRVRAARPDG